MDNVVLDWFRAKVHRAGGGSYQTLMNDALREVMLEGARFEPSVPLWMQSYLSPGGALGPAGKAVAGLRDLATIRITEMHVPSISRRRSAEILASSR